VDLRFVPFKVVAVQCVIRKVMMTEAEAFQFLSKCQRLWLRQKGLMPGQILE
jgi:hypothetical protein